MVVALVCQVLAVLSQAVHDGQKKCLLQLNPGSVVIISCRDSGQGPTGASKKGIACGSGTRLYKEA